MSALRTLLGAGGFVLASVGLYKRCKQRKAIIPTQPTAKEEIVPEVKPEPSCGIRGIKTNAAEKRRMKDALRQQLNPKKGEVDDQSEAPETETRKAGTG